MSDYRKDMESVRDGFHAIENGLTALNPLVEQRLSKADMRKFRKLKVTVWRAHADALELAEEINGGSGGEIMPLGGST